MLAAFGITQALYRFSLFNLLPPVFCTVPFKFWQTFVMLTDRNLYNVRLCIGLGLLHYYIYM